MPVHAAATHVGGGPARVHAGAASAARCCCRPRARASTCSAITRSADSVFKQEVKKLAEEASTTREQ